ncbi:MAG: ribosome biogenesis GTPase YlqF [Tissierellia bacterium]|nr:ribosome biogenesis GTPase YlqF [Tissierellia bacterium]
MNINWYPGHMKKTADSIRDNLKKVDVVLELIDARAPRASENPMIPDLIGDKLRILIFNKGDLADPRENARWLNYYKEEKVIAVSVNSNTGKGINELLDKIDEVMEEKREKDRTKGIISQRVRAMIIGIPNVGKSTLINTLASRKSAKVGNMPGITRTNQWIKVEDRLLLLDTPGVLWPKFESEELALNLAFIGSIRDEVLPKEDVALKLVEVLQNKYPRLLVERYGVEISNSPLETMENIAKKRGAIMRGNEIDYTRVTDLILDEFRKGVIGNITLETVDVRD